MPDPSVQPPEGLREIIDRITAEIKRWRAEAYRRAAQSDDEVAAEANNSFADGLSIALGVIDREMRFLAAESMSPCLSAKDSESEIDT